MFFLFLLACAGLSASLSTSAALSHFLLDNGYNSSDRPVKNENDTLNLSISFNSFTLLRMDQSEETVIFSAEVILEWNDAFLRWQPAAFNGMTRLKMKEINVWRPDVTVSTSISKETLLDESDRYLDVFHDGTVRQSMYAVFTNVCEMEVGEFPYDSQECIIDIGPWSYTDEEVHTIPGPSVTAPRDDFKGNSEWDFKGLIASEIYSTDADVDFHFSEARFQLFVSRRPQFYVWVLLIPTFVITTISIFGMFIPTNSLGDKEEKVNLGLTTLLSSAVILQIVADSMPKASALPLLGNFILAEIFVVAAGVLCSVLTLTLHHRANTRRWKPKPWMLKILGVTGASRFTTKTDGRMIRNKADTTSGLHCVEGAPLVADFLSTLRSLIAYLDEEDVDRLREIAWLKLFDRLDFLLLVCFVIANCILTIVMIGH
ncbi:hypothetical protein Q1695_014507 [Nippostrongylus brasiliensis]|nr:hypothetical protein Q1695_014507 [Nippostrongylus brasiliensis]